MRYTVLNTEAGVVVAEYEADAPKIPAEIDPAYVGEIFVTKDEAGETVLTGAVAHVWPSWQFKRFFTKDERIKIRDAAKTDTLVVDLLDILDSAPEVSSDDQDVIDGVNHLEESEIIGVGRAAQIMKGN